MGQYNATEQALLNKLRTSISHLMDTQSQFALPATLEETELYNALELGLEFWNSYPPFETEYTLTNMPSKYYGSLTLCAQFFCGIQMQWFEVGKHFIYNDNGLSITRDRSGKYNQLCAQILSALTALLIIQKKIIGLNQNNLLKGQFSSIVSFPRSLTRGLRGTRLGSSPSS